MRLRGPKGSPGARAAQVVDRASARATVPTPGSSTPFPTCGPECTRAGWDLRGPPAATTSPWGRETEAQMAEKSVAEMGKGPKAPGSLRSAPSIQAGRAPAPRQVSRWAGNRPLHLHNIHRYEPRRPHLSDGDN